MGASATAVRVVRRQVGGFRCSQDLLVAVMLHEELLIGKPPTVTTVLCQTLGAQQGPLYLDLEPRTAIQAVARPGPSPSIRLWSPGCDKACLKSSICASSCRRGRRWLCTIGRKLAAAG